MRGDTIGKVIGLTFADNEEEVADKIVAALVNKKNFKYMGLPQEQGLHFCDLKIFPDKREVYHKGKEVGLTYMQFEILYLLARSPGRVFTKDIIYDLLWYEPYSGDYNIVMSHISHIRKKIEDNPSNPIYTQTVWGVGYRFNAKLGNM